MNFSAPETMLRRLRLLTKLTQQRLRHYLADPEHAAQYVTDNRLTYLPIPRLLDLARATRTVGDNHAIQGIVIQAGCALGGSLLVMAKYAQRRQIHVYDTFTSPPPPTEDDTDDAHDRYEVIRSGHSPGINNDTYYGYRTDILSLVTSHLSIFCGHEVLQRIIFKQGLLQETMRIDEPVAFAHIDVDWYEPVLHCLTTIWPHLSRKGVIIVDDYSDWGGCKKAVDQFFHAQSNYRCRYINGSLELTKL